MVGIIGVCQFLPMLMFSLFAGVIVDRFPKKNIIIFTQILFMAQAAVMAALTFTGLIRVEHVLILTALYGLTQTLDTPARQSYFIDLVGKENLMNAISLNSTVFNIARIVGPAISGLVMVLVGTSFCFLINAVSFIPVIITMSLITARGMSTHSATRQVLPEIAEGIRYIAKNETLIVNVLAMASICTFAMNNDVIIPVFARTVLGSGAQGYTGLMSAWGVGAFIGAIFLAYTSRGKIRKKMLILSGGSLAVLQILTVTTRNYLLCIIIVGAIGFANLAFLNTANTIFQLSSSDEYRGRVMSVYSFLNQGSTPLGNFFAGSVMENVGGDSGFVSCGLAALLTLAAIVTAKRKTIMGWMKPQSKSV